MCKKKNIILLAMCLMTACNSSTSPPISSTPIAKEIPKASEIEFQDLDFQAALDLSSKTGKLVFADFHADWCRPCKDMEKQVFVDPKVAHYFNDKFINLKIDVTKDPGKKLKQKYRVYDLPSLLFLDGTGEAILSSIGFVDAPLLLELGQDALSD